MERKFLKWIPNNKKLSGPAVTITKRQIMFNRACHEFFFNKPFCEILIDEAALVVGLRFIHKEYPSTVKIVGFVDKKPNISTKYINATGFIEKYLYGPLRLGEKGRQIPAEWEEKNKLLVVDVAAYVKSMAPENFK